jgi:hypothetical protein
MKAAVCISHEDGHWLAAERQTTLQCKRLKEDLDLCIEARNVLGNPDSKRTYDQGAEPTKDYYALLKVDRSASATDIKQSYFALTIELSKQTAQCDRPETVNTAQCVAVKQQKADLDEAYAILSDPSSREIYSHSDTAGQESLNFVSSPLQLVNRPGASPLTWLLPVFVAVAVLWYLSKENERLNPAEFRAGRAEPLGDEDDTDTDSKDTAAAAQSTSSATSDSKKKSN